MKKKIKKGSLISSVMIPFVFLFLITSEKSLCSEDLTEEHRFGKEYLHHLFDDSIRIYSSPIKWDRGDYLKCSAVLGTGLVLFVYDESLYNWVQKNETEHSEEAFGFVTDLGHGAFFAGISTLLYTTGEISGNDELRKIGLYSFQSWLTTGLFIIGMKISIGRSRPNVDQGAYSFRPFGFSSRNHSFPSGHAASSFAVAAVISEYSGMFVDILCYSLAAMVAFSRVHLEKHWMSDVFMGSALGYFIGKKVCDLNAQRDQNRIQVGFDFNKEYSGITLSFSF
jgi:membrane-associated phospholipid phosphatase